MYVCERVCLSSCMRACVYACVRAKFSFKCCGCLGRDGCVLVFRQTLYVLFYSLKNSFPVSNVNNKLRRGSHVQSIQPIIGKHRVI